MKNKIFLLIFLAVVSIASLFFWRTSVIRKEIETKAFYDKNLQAEKEFQDKITLQEIEKQNQKQLAENEASRLQSENNKNQIAERETLTKVPFTSQAPLGHWSDMRFQDGCEEASIAMAMKWVSKKTFSSPSLAEQEIINIADFETNTFGHYIDSSVDDLGKTISQLYGFENFSVKKNPTLSNLKKELEAGNILLVPVYGRALKNPNFKSPGPIAHMLVLVGWDDDTKEFIANDPGTRRGEGYRYGEKLFFNAMWAYPSDKNHPNVPKSTDEKSILIVRRN